MAFLGAGVAIMALESGLFKNISNTIFKKRIEAKAINTLTTPEQINNRITYNKQEIVNCQNIIGKAEAKKQKMTAEIAALEEMINNIQNKEQATIDTNEEKKALDTYR